MGPFNVVFSVGRLFSHLPLNLHFTIHPSISSLIHSSEVGHLPGIGEGGGGQGNTDFLCISFFLPIYNAYETRRDKTTR